MRTLPRVVLVGFPLILMLSCGGGGLDHEWHPDQLFRTHEAELRDYVRRINAGKVYEEDKRGYAIPQFLIDNGAKYVKKQDDGCIVIHFNFMPTDAVPELWYCERGFDPIPAGLQNRRQNEFFHWEQLAPDWGFCKWDQ